MLSFLTRVTSGCACIAALCASVAVVRAEPPIGDTSQALPGVHRVPVIALGSTGLHTAMDAGYGLTESQNREGSHHRVLGSVGVGLVAMPGLEFGAMTTLRYDRHPNDGLGTDSGTIGQVALVSRYGAWISRSVALGLDVGGLFPGAEKPADALSNPAIDIRSLVGWQLESGVRFGAVAGYRIDYTGGVGNNAPHYRAGDRLALGISDFNAVLLGMGAVVPWRTFEFLGEVTGDILVGHDAPGLSKSPLRVDLGIRKWLTRRLQAELLSEYSLSSRPTIAAGSALVPIEPRVSIVLGVRYQFSAQASPAVQARAVPMAPAVSPVQSKPDLSKSPPAPHAAAPPATGQVIVEVFDHEGHPLSDAVVRLITDSGVHPLVFKKGSTFELDDAPIGKAQLAVTADLMRTWSKHVEITAKGQLELRVDMVAAEVSGQIRGQVRAFNGRRLAAHIQIAPGDYETQSDAEGIFSVDVAPGKYRVKIWLDGYQSQERSVQVGKNGVMVLNVDMQQGP